MFNGPGRTALWPWASFIQEKKLRFSSESNVTGEAGRWQMGGNAGFILGEKHQGGINVGKIKRNRGCRKESGIMVVSKLCEQ